MNDDPWSGLPVSKIYQIVYDSLKMKCEMEGVPFNKEKAVRTIAKTHAGKVEDLIDEDMTEYDERRLTDIVERCVARYVELEE